MTTENRRGPWARFTEIRSRSRELIAAEDRTGWRHEQRMYLQGIVVLSIVGINSSLIRRFGGDLPTRWSPSRIPWSPVIEKAYPEIRSELESYLARTAMPQTAELSGLDPETEEGRNAAPADRGIWRSLMLNSHGEIIEENAQHFPATMAAIGAAKGATSIGFSALDANSHIASHVDPNDGALRYAMPILTPGPPASSRLRIGSELVSFEAGHPVIFDISVSHEVWNDSDEPRVLLMIETQLPLRAPIRLFNRVAQSCYRFHPSYNNLPQRARSLALAEATRTKPAATS